MYPGRKLIEAVGGAGRLGSRVGAGLDHRLRPPRRLTTNRDLPGVRVRVGLLLISLAVPIDLPRLRSVTHGRPVKIGPPRRRAGKPSMIRHSNLGGLETLTSG